MNLGAVWTVFRFECSRTATAARLLALAVLAAFPPALVALMQTHHAELQRDARGVVALFVLIPELLCLMNLLLSAAPLVYAELEGKTWTYLAISPAGKGAILFGKYWCSVFFAVIAGWLSLALCCLLAWPEHQGLQIASTLFLLVPLGCLVYGAIFVFLGVIFLRRAMIAAVVYIFISEVLIGFIPALINQLTIQYHLRNLLTKWIGWDLIAGPLQMNRQFFSDSPAWHHVAILTTIAAVFLAMAVLVLRRRELALSDQP
jgi:ABC-type transport system involved in multi-copper enzyme maturation permease subunit